MNSYKRFFKIINELKVDTLEGSNKKGSMGAISWVKEVNNLYLLEKFPKLVQWILNMKILSKCHQTCNIKQLDELNIRIEKFEDATESTQAIISFLNYLKKDYYKQQDDKERMINFYSRDNDIMTEQVAEDIEKDRKLQKQIEMKKKMSIDEYQKYLKEQQYLDDYTTIPKYLFDNADVIDDGLRKDSNNKVVFGYIVTGPIYNTYGLFTLYYKGNKLQQDFERVKDGDIYDIIDFKFAKFLMNKKSNKPNVISKNDVDIDIDHVKKAMGINDSNDPIQNRINNDLNGDIF